MQVNSVSFTYLPGVSAMNYLKPIELFALLSATIFLSFNSVAAPINLMSDFAGDPEVSFSTDGTAATFVESEFVSLVFLTNDPFLGDPFIIEPGENSLLSFDYSFEEGQDDNDLFSAIIFLSGENEGPVAGELDKFSISDTQSGNFVFDLSDYVFGDELLTLGLQFELVDLDPAGDETGSSAIISNLEISQVPLPSALWLFGSALLGLRGVSRAGQTR